MIRGAAIWRGPAGTSGQGAEFAPVLPKPCRIRRLFWPFKAEPPRGAPSHRALAAGRPHVIG
ncbi:hypothetical protein GCM10017056_24170 [Seohaeicola zhoushanensis]|uniref:Uncharacterized protein n=1 Tax=Seohaeicola zhoushanensis TaxID=1569283 RepID=A0A8J3GY80_9RHOB|nr:hypothetical protein GCM10017056_24170 [Seohaeicola zhoushanensis]